MCGIRTATPQLVDGEPFYSPAVPRTNIHTSVDEQLRNLLRVSEIGALHVLHAHYS